ncbi:ADP-ribose pyrophosphatase YjhB, NUDIX family [Pedobacter steynii]|uniref:ADP-ribose pyrophosphatase YjhB, NUDIX family n=1 Tax=Pedobacter steynii TaxID=430522 RepID=A0A1G9RSG1_9SPHI|nr:NUDIX domain-containing protein [Pedobacter steynii]NQX37668.1 NUDIX domain-containing protein [Pedobacter steynii]SDM26010.1 ADP-ribose pyrophosphatase YjhB, NUDIX family [Pedobacter steynii]
MKNYRIYINDNTLFIADSAPKQEKEIQQIDVQNFDFKQLYKSIPADGKKDYLLLDADPQAVFKKIKNSLTLIKAAGGLVKSAKGNYLFIFRNKKWDLPKGKVEKDEKMKEAALREVEEECGVKIYTNDEKLCKTYHVYTIGSKVVLKKTNWYSMTVKGEPKLIPQKEEGITKASWLSTSELAPVLGNTYPSIIQVLEAGALLKESDSVLG